MPFTMLHRDVSIPREPAYLTIQIRTGVEQVLSIVPPYLQGTTGVIQLIVSFIGTSYKWVQVKGDVTRMYANRNRDLYFVFWICSHCLPIAHTLTGLRSHVAHRSGSRRLTCVDKGSQMLPLGQHGLYYTRNGHLGRRQELAHLIRTVSCRGYVTTIQPLLYNTGGRHIVLTRRVGHWSPSAVGNTVVVHVDHITHMDPTIPWDYVVLDNIRLSSQSKCYLYPDSRHLSGKIAHDWLLFDQYFSNRKKTIVYMESLSTDVDLVDYMYILQTRYRGEQFIGNTYTRERASVVRLAETMILEGIVEIV